MKNIIVILALVLIGNTRVSAQCMLKVSTADKQAINVAVDGRYFNKRGTSVTVGDLPAGAHYLQIYGVVRKRNGRLREAVIYEGRLSLNQGMITIFVYDIDRGGTIDEQDINTYYKDHPVPQGAPAGNGQNTGNTDKSNAGNNDNNSDASVATPVAIDNAGTLTDARITAIKAKSDAKKTDTDKLKVLKEELKNEKITTDQVAYMMDWINFESTKLEFAKWAYDITADKDNYPMLNAKFTYKNYEDEFDNFVKGKK